GAWGHRKVPAREATPTTRRTTTECAEQFQVYAGDSGRHRARTALREYPFDTALEHDHGDGGCGCGGQRGDRGRGQDHGGGHGRSRSASRSGTDSAAKKELHRGHLREGTPR